jgi:hypothetical protein
MHRVSWNKTCEGYGVVYPQIHLPKDLKPAPEGACPSEAAENHRCPGAALAEAGTLRMGARE